VVKNSYGTMQIMNTVRGFGVHVYWILHEFSFDINFDETSFQVILRTI